jgi:D-alanyl-D-alanine carboxypeptidase
MRFEMRRIQKQVFAVVSVLIVLMFMLPFAAGAVSVGGVEISSSGAVVIDFETGSVLFGHNEAVQRVPASMIKMVAAHVVYDAIRDGASDTA